MSKFMVIRGKVSAGCGQAGKSNTFSPALDKMLGYKIYPGTLNITVANLTTVRKDIAALKSVHKNLWRGELWFGKEMRYCWLLQWEGTKAKYLEIISPTNLRRSMRLNDGDKVELRLCISK